MHSSRQQHTVSDMMGNRGPPSKASKVKPAAKPAQLAARGSKNGPKRTPRNLGDAAGTADMYKVRDITSERLTKTRPEWLVCWKGYGAADDTWEPLGNLTSCERFIERFRSEQAKRNEEAETEPQTNTRRRQEAAEESTSQEPMEDATDLVPTGSKGKQTSCVHFAFIKDPADPTEKHCCAN